MKKTIENERYILTVKDQGAEISSLFDKKTGYEIFYQGDQGWSGQAPTLFPIVGSTWKEGSFEIEGKQYAMKNHGLIRYATLSFQPDDQDIVLTFSSNEQTRSQYPYDFYFEVRYHLLPDGLEVSYCIQNRSSKTMPFSFGLHPAFKTSQMDQERFEDFSIEFFPPITGEQLIFYSDKRPVKRLPVHELSHWTFNREQLKEHDTLVFEDKDLNSVTLLYKGVPRLKMSFENYPYFAIWSSAIPSDFICLEPWYGHGDFEKVKNSFENREGTQYLLPNCLFKTKWTLKTY